MEGLYSHLSAEAEKRVKSARREAYEKRIGAGRSVLLSSGMGIEESISETLERGKRVKEEAKRRRVLAARSVLRIERTPEEIREAEASADYIVVRPDTEVID